MKLKRLSQSEPKYFCAKYDGQHSCTSEVRRVTFGNPVRMVWTPLGVQKRETRTTLPSWTP